MGKLTISMVIFNSFLYVYQRVVHTVRDFKVQNGQSSFDKIDTYIYVDHMGFQLKIWHLQFQRIEKNVPING